MRKRQRLGLTVAAGVIALILAGVIFNASRKPEPEYQEKKLNVWLDEMAARNAFGYEDNVWLDEMAARNAFGYEEMLRKIGTNALPYVVRNLARNDSSLRSKYRELRLKSPQILQRFLPQPQPLLEVVQGANVFSFIGTNSIPSAIALLRHESPTVRRAAAWGICTLRRQSPAANQAIPALTAALEDSDKQVRFYTLLAFNEMGADASNAVPAITKILTSHASPTNADSYVQAAAASALGKIGPAADSALPALRTALQATNSYLRGQAAVAIWRIGGDVDAALPVLLREMPAESEHSKWDWIIAIGEMGPLAKAALPQLKRELVEDKEVWVLDYVTNALRRVDPESYEKKPEP